MAAARPRTWLFDAGERPRADHLRALCVGEHQRGTRAGTHLAADTLAQHYSLRTRDWLRRLGAAFALLPWALFVFVSGKSFVVPSLMEMEAFPETNNPGYFLVKSGLWLMAITIIAQALLDIFRPFRTDDV
jgi:TRAP-type mannitol/chloroaromatic compound transport system permease small subunit